MSDEPDAIKTANGVIPYFFYDVIAKIIPGAWLLIGCIWTWRGPRAFFDSWANPIGLPSSELKDAGVAEVSAFFLLFLGASALAGSLLGSLSYVFVDRVWKKIFGRLTLAGLEGFSGAKFTMLTQSFSDKFDATLIEADIDQSSFLCSQYAWRHSERLGAMTSRLDAEKLAAQSSVLVSLLLTIEYVVLLFYRSSFNRFDCLWLFALLTILAASLLSFHYHRKKRVYGRFHAFITLSKMSPEAPKRNEK